MARILLLEPDQARGNHISQILTEAGHSCTLCICISDGFSFLQKECRAMTILNARLPWADSTLFLHSLEQRGLPVLFIASDPSNLNHLQALYQSDSSAVCEDCDDNELILAVESLLSSAPSRMTLGNLVINTDDRCICVKGGKEQSLTQQEYALLKALIEANGMPCSREELLRTAWGYQSMGMTRTVDVHIQRLRRKLGSDYIETIHKLGYRFHIA